MDPVQTQKYYQQLARSIVEQQSGLKQAQATIAGQGPSSNAPATTLNRIGLLPHKTKSLNRPQHSKQQKPANAGPQQQPPADAQKEYDEGLVSMHLMFGLFVCGSDHVT